MTVGSSLCADNAPDIASPIFATFPARDSVIAVVNSSTDSEVAFSPNRFDIVVSNPPYVSQTEYETLQPEIRDFEPAGAVSDTEDGYKFYKRLCSIAKGLLNPDGYLYFEIGKGQEKTVKVLFETNGFTEIVIVKDYLDIERVIYGKIE